MLSFFKKPFVFALLYSLCLVGALCFSLMDVFVIPTPDTSTEYETLDFSQFFPSGETDTQKENILENVTSAIPTLTLPPIGGVVEPTPDTDATEDNDPEVIPDQTEAETPTPSYPIITDDTYIDQHITIRITTLRRYDSDIHVAEVIIDDPSYLKTALARDKFGTNITEETSDQAQRVGAILAINGDYYGANKTGYVVRNGTLYRDSQRSTKYQDLAIFYDGSMDVFYEKDVAVRDIWQKRGAMQIMAFGPTLVYNGQIVVGQNEEVGVASPNGNPRTVIGMVEPLHYYFVVADGRTSSSHGPSLYEMADIMTELGCTLAYNLDGGGSSTMVFNGKVINYPTTNGNYKERSVSDIVYIGY